MIHRLCSWLLLGLITALMTTVMTVAALNLLATTESVVQNAPGASQRPFQDAVGDTANSAAERVFSATATRVYASGSCGDGLIYDAERDRCVLNLPTPTPTAQELAVVTPTPTPTPTASPTATAVASKDPALLEMSCDERKDRTKRLRAFAEIPPGTPHFTSLLPCGEGTGFTLVWGTPPPTPTP